MIVEESRAAATEDEALSDYWRLSQLAEVDVIAGRLAAAVDRYAETCAVLASRGPARRGLRVVQAHRRAVRRRASLLGRLGLPAEAVGALEHVWVPGPALIPSGTSRIGTLWVLPGDDHLVVLLKTRTTSGWRADGIVQAVPGAALQAAMSGIAAASRQGTSRDGQLRTAYNQLAGLVADPVVELVAKHGIDELRVADDEGVLSLLGLEALPCKDSEYLDDLCNVSYLPVPPEHSPWIASRAPVGGAPRILLIGYLDDDLSAAADEVQFLRALPNVDVTYLPAEACTKRDILQQLTSDHSHVHFACHGVLDVGVARAEIPEYHDANFDPSRSALLLRRDKIDQRFRVEARDLDGLSMASRPLVTLSSCSTAGARSGLAAGVAGLPERFLRGGATAVVGARWEVSDRYACKFTKLVYTSIADGLSARSAFFRARQELRRRTTCEHWAAWCYLEGFGGLD